MPPKWSKPKKFKVHQPRKSLKSFFCWVRARQNSPGTGEEAEAAPRSPAPSRSPGAPKRPGAAQTGALSDGPPDVWLDVALFLGQKFGLFVFFFGTAPRQKVSLSPFLEGGWLRKGWVAVDRPPGKKGASHFLGGLVKKAGLLLTDPPAKREPLTCWGG